MKPDGTYSEEPPLPHGVFGAMGGLLTTAADEALNGEVVGTRVNLRTIRVRVDRLKPNSESSDGGQVCTLRALPDPTYPANIGFIKRLAEVPNLQQLWPKMKLDGPPV